jgi:hypothetical protein
MGSRRRAEPPRELDVVEVAGDGLELARSNQATVVQVFGDGTLLLEVVQEDGQAAAMPIVPQSAVRVIWRAAESRLPTTTDVAGTLSR